MSEEFSFTAPDGGDPVDYFEKTALKLGSASPDALVEAAIYLEDQIRARTREGMSFNGTSFIAYNDEYLKQRTKAGLSNDVVNLSFTGNMMAAMATRVNPSSKQIEIGFFNNAKQSIKAKINNEGGYFALEHNLEHGVKIRVRFNKEKHDTHKGGFVVIPDRPFLGLTQNDLDKAAEILATFKAGDEPVNANPYGFTEAELAMDSGSENEFLHSGPKKSKKKKRIDY